MSMGYSSVYASRRIMSNRPVSGSIPWVRAHDMIINMIRVQLALLLLAGVGMLMMNNLGLCHSCPGIFTSSSLVRRR